jgi:hypothetical protein
MVDPRVEAWLGCVAQTVGMACRPEQNNVSPFHGCDTQYVDRSRVEYTPDVVVLKRCGVFAGWEYFQRLIPLPAFYAST